MKKFFHKELDYLLISKQSYCYFTAAAATATDVAFPRIYRKLLREVVDGADSNILLSWLILGFLPKRINEQKNCMISGREMEERILKKEPIV